jgi:hypothetical protein
MLLSLARGIFVGSGLAPLLLIDLGHSDNFLTGVVLPFVRLIFLLSHRFLFLSIVCDLAIRSRVFPPLAGSAIVSLNLILFLHIFPYYVCSSLGSNGMFAA